jgi:hypothetical protein
MKLPNADLAIIDSAKMQGYLLSSLHPVGRFKAAFFASLGYGADRWERLRDDIAAIAHNGDTLAGSPSPFGQKYEVDGILVGPNGRSAQVRTVWIVLANEQAPRFITAFPR